MARACSDWKEGDTIIAHIAPLSMHAAQQWAITANKDKLRTSILPQQYLYHARIFSEKGTERFPPSQPNDMAVQLKPGALDTLNHKVYPLTQVVMTVRLGLLFSFHLFPISPSLLLLYYGHSSFAPCYSLKLDLPSDTETGTRCLVDCAPPPLSITCLTLALTVPSTRASVPADVHPLCPSYAPSSSLLPYVSSHHWCAPSNPLTCVTPCPLYVF